MHFSVKGGLAYGLLTHFYYTTNSANYVGPRRAMPAPGGAALLIKMLFSTFRFQGGVAVGRARAVYPLPLGCAQMGA